MSTSEIEIYKDATLLTTSRFYDKLNPEQGKLFEDDLLSREVATHSASGQLENKSNI